MCVRSRKVSRKNLAQTLDVDRGTERGTQIANSCLEARSFPLRPTRSTITYHTQLAHSPWFATTHQIPNNRHRRTHEPFVHSFPRDGCALETIEIRSSRGQYRFLRGGTPRGYVAFTTVRKGVQLRSATVGSQLHKTEERHTVVSRRVVSYGVASFRRVRGSTATGDSRRHGEISLAFRLRSLNAVTRYHRDRSKDGD